MLKHQFYFVSNVGKFVSPDMIARRVAKSGDGSHSKHSEYVWGFGDTDICKDDLKDLNQMQS